MMGSIRLQSAKSSALLVATALSALLLPRAVHGLVHGQPCHVASTGSYYEAAADAFPVDVTATAGNPFKGLATSPAWHSSLPYRTDIPASLEFHFLSLASVMDGPASFTFAAGLEPALIASASRDTHAILRFWVDFPNQAAVGVPQYLVDAGLTFNAFAAYGGGRSPDYHDSRLIDAFVAFAAALGAQYDGDPRIAAVQIGLVGFWGEWHTYPDMARMPSVTDQNRVIAAFDGAFNTTELEILSSKSGLANSGTVGFHDNSFTYATLVATDSTPIPWFYEPQLAASGPSATSSWTHSMIGGEVRVENQAALFDSDFGAPDTYKQDFDQCVAATHASWMVNWHAFALDGGYTGAALSAAQASVSGMGYNLRITSVAATVVDAAGCNGIPWPCAAVDVAIANDGVAPFYYDLAPLLDLPVLCSPNQSATSIPASSDESSAPTTPSLTRRSLGLANAAQFRFYLSGSGGCLPALKLRLSSTKAYANRPVNLAHTYDGSGVPLNIPDPPCPVSTEDPSPPTNPSTSTVAFTATTTDAPNLNNGAASSADDSSTAATAGIAAAVVVSLLGLVGVVIARRRQQRQTGAPTAKAASEHADHADDGVAGVQWRDEEREERAPDALELVTLNATLPAGGSDASPHLDVATAAAKKERESEKERKRSEVGELVESDVVDELVESDVVGELVGAGPASFVDEAGRRASFAEETIVM